MGIPKSFKYFKTALKYSAWGYVLSYNPLLIIFSVAVFIYDVNFY